MRSSRVFLSFSVCSASFFVFVFYIWTLQFVFVSMQNLYRRSLSFWAFSDGGCWLYLSVYWGILHSLALREREKYGRKKASGFIIVFLFRYRSFWFQGVFLPVSVFHGYLRLYLFDFFQGVREGIFAPWPDQEKARFWQWSLERQTRDYRKCLATEWRRESEYIKQRHRFLLPGTKSTTMSPELLNLLWWSRHLFSSPEHPELWNALHVKERFRRRWYWQCFKRKLVAGVSLLLKSWSTQEVMSIG